MMADVLACRGDEVVARLFRGEEIPMNRAKNPASEDADYSNQSVKHVNKARSTKPWPTKSAFAPKFSKK
jgi:hypothetical protein